MLSLEPRIKNCFAKHITDSRGMATIEVEVVAKIGLDEVSAKAAVPSGKSTGSEEAVALRDADGGILQAIDSVEKKIAPKIAGMALDSEDIDHAILSLDTTRNKEHIGANAMLGVSMAVMRLEAKVKNIPLWKLISQKSGYPAGRPILYMNTLNGGAHADFCLPFQEYILAVGGKTLTESNEKAIAIFEKVRQKLAEKKMDYFMGDEGGFALRTSDLEEPFRILTDCIEKDPNIFIAIDAAASEFYRKENQKYELNGNLISRGDLLMLYKGLSEKYDLKSIEDPFYEKDLTGFEEITKWIGDSVLIVGDDLTVTNSIMIRKYGDRGLVNGMIVKPNQIGTMVETFGAIHDARKYGWKIIVSHRSGETMDPFVADLAVGVGAYGIKAGAHTQPERRAKYDRLLEIEKELVADAEQEQTKKKDRALERKNQPYY
ncbi:MAG: phosphopyruvate hydratase [Candidatus Paceibacterota bacterium]|jgi:enolase|nr:phosphopyruvate hydratase [Candidatus Paceibacterota bacterium]